MNTVPAIQTILNVATISQYKSVQDIRSNNFSGTQVIDKSRPNLIRTLRKAIQNAYNENPTDPALVSTGEYLYGLCAPYSQYALGVIANLTQAAPVISGPANETVNVGQNAVFSVSVVSVLPVTYQWYDTFGNPILGATGASYTVLNAQLSQSGSTFFVKATNAAGQTVSSTANLIVTQSLLASYYFGSTDFSTDINSGNDDVPYVGTFPITSGQPLSFVWPSGAANQFLVVRYPVAESTKTAYANAPLNNGLIPSIAFDNVKTIGNFKYIFTRNGNTFGFTTANALIFS